MNYYTDGDARFVMFRMLSELPGATGRAFKRGYMRSGWSFKITGPGYEIIGRGPGEYTLNGVKYTNATDVLREIHHKLS